MTMELRRIQYFLAVAQEGHFTRAAARLGIGQPPLSAQIKSLERDVGATLFRRLPHGAELTAAGHAFRQAVENMPTQLEGAFKLAQGAARGEIGVLRAGFTASSAFNAVVPGTIRAFRRAYPAVELTFEEANTTHLLTGLHDETLDIVFVRPSLHDLGQLRVRRLSNEPLLAALPADHAASQSDTVDLRMLMKEPFLLFPRWIGQKLYDTFVEACQQAGFDPHVEHVAPQISSIINLVGGNIGGVTIVPASMRQIQTPGVVFRPIQGSTPNATLSLAHRRQESSKLVLNFMAIAVSN